MSDTTTKPAAMGHTPGPWMIEPDLITDREGHEYYAVRALVPDWGHDDIATVKVHSETTLDHDRANAKLISAAPSLLEACLALVEFWDNGTPVHPGAEVVADVRQAIAKATGGQS